MSYKNLLNIEVKPIHSEEEREHLVKVCQDKGGVLPIFPTHLVKKHGEIVGCFSIASPTVYWWMSPEDIGIKESIPIYQACDTLMTQQGYHSYIIPCEPESPYFGLLSKRLNTICTEGGDDFKLFINKT